MALNHTNPGAQPRESRAQPVAPKRTTPGPQHRQYSVAGYVVLGHLALVCDLAFGEEVGGVALLQ